MKKPQDAQRRIHRFFYKLGLHGYVFRWNGREWMRSTLTEKEMLQGEKV